MAFVVLTTRRCGSSKGVVGDVAGEHSVGFGMVALRWFWDGRAWVCVCVLFAFAFRSLLGLRFVCVCVCVWVSRCVLRLRLLSYCDSCGGGRAFVLAV